MTVSAKSIHLTKATAAKNAGTFTADIEWDLTVGVTGAIEDQLVDLLPDHVAALFPELPLEGYVYPDHPLVTCRGVSCERVDSLHYKYKAKFSDENADVENGEPGTNENPLLDRPDIQPTAGMKTIPLLKDRITDEAVMNTANDPILRETEDNTIGFSIEANVAAIPWWILGIRNSTNDAPIVVDTLTIPKNAARIILPNDWKRGPKSRNGIQFYVFKFELVIDEQDQHFGRPLNAGFRELVPRYELDGNGDPADPPVQATDGDGNLLWDKVEITEEDGSKPSDPEPLAADGTKIEHPTPENSVFLEIGDYFEADFSVLPGVEAAP